MNRVRAIRAPQIFASLAIVAAALVAGVSQSANASDNASRVAGEPSVTAAALRDIVVPASESASPARRFIVKGTAPLKAVDAEDLDWAKMLSTHDGTQWTGKPVEEVAAAQAGLAGFTAAANRVKDSDPGNFVEAGQVAEGLTQGALSDGGSTDGYRAWVTLKSEPSTKTLAILSEGQSLPVQIRVGAPASAEALDVLSTAVTGAFLKDLPVRDVLTDAAWDTITVRYSLAEETNVDLEARARKGAAEAAKLAGTDGLPVAIHFVRDDSLKGIEYHYTVNGGQNLVSCTSGWPVNRGGQLGITTAAHCPDALTWTGITGVIQFIAEAGSTLSSNGVDWGQVDLQFHRTLSSNTTPAKFWNGSATKDVVGYGNPAVNDPLCKYGITTGTTCGNVASTLNKCYAHWSGVGYACGFWRANYSGTYGDSGGPVFESRTARGTVSGQDSDGYATFVPISRVAGDLGASVLTW